MKEERRITGKWLKRVVDTYTICSIKNRKAGLKLKYQHFTEAGRYGPQAQEPGMLTMEDD